MNTKANTRQAEAVPEQKKPYATPQLRREAQVPLITAGSFDLIIPNP